MQVTALSVLKDNYCWIIDLGFSNDPKYHVSVAIIDPGESAPILEYCRSKNASVDAIFLTHHHWDHVDGLPAIKQAYPHAKVYAAENNETTGITNYLIEGQSFKIDDVDFSISMIPGHTLDHMLIMANDRHLFTGDALFSAGCGRIFEGTTAQMYTSLMRIAQYDDDCLLYCGHEYTLNNINFALSILPEDASLQMYKVQSTAKLNRELPTLPSRLGLEKRVNLFLRCHEPDVQAAIANLTGQKISQPIDAFTMLRKLKDDYT